MQSKNGSCVDRTDLEAKEDENWHPRMLGFQLLLSRVRRLFLVLLSVMRSGLIVSVLFFFFFFFSVSLWI